MCQNVLGTINKLSNNFHHAHTKDFVEKQTPCPHSPVLHTHRRQDNINMDRILTKIK